MTSRRNLLKLMGATTLSGLLPTWPKVTFGQQSSDGVCVVVFLRGGADGLNTLVPSSAADKALYQQHRPQTHMTDWELGNSTSGALDNGNFKCHPALNPLSDLIAANKVTFFPATHGGIDLTLGDAGIGTMSHFGAQEALESGTSVLSGKLASLLATSDVKHGWLARTLDQVTLGVPDLSNIRAFGFNNTHVFSGNPNVITSSSIGSGLGDVTNGNEWYSVDEIKTFLETGGGDIIFPWFSTPFGDHNSLVEHFNDPNYTDQDKEATYTFYSQDLGPNEYGYKRADLEKGQLYNKQMTQLCEADAACSANDYSQHPRNFINNKERIIQTSAYDRVEALVAANGGEYQDAGSQFEQAAKLILGVDADGNQIPELSNLQMVAIDDGGYDHHGGLKESLNVKLTRLASELKGLYDNLANCQKNVTVVVMTEFGRTVDENNSQGTDHGQAFTAMVMKAGASQANSDNIYFGNRNGAQGQWPGLSNLIEPVANRLHLNSVTDYRDILIEVLVKTVGLDRQTAESIFQAADNDFTAEQIPIIT